MIVSSFLTQYGIRIYSNDFKLMGWNEFKTLLAGLQPETPLGRIVSIRAEDDNEVIKNFTKEQRRIWSDWRSREAENRDPVDAAEFYESMKKVFVQMAGGTIE